MRATSPRDNLGVDAVYVEIPKPKFPIGTRVDLSKVADYNRPYYIRQIRRGVITPIRQAINQLQADGMLNEMKGKKMLDCHKEGIREIFKFMETADGVFVCGHAPSEIQSRNSIANQCYLKGGIGFGGISFNYYLMFRKKVRGQELVYHFPDPLISESEMQFCAVGRSTATKGSARKGGK